MMRLLALLVTALFPSAAEQWSIRYFHDEDRSSMAIHDLAFPSPERGVAVASITEGTKVRGATVTTDNGGKTWQVTPSNEIGRHLFFLNGRHGWMVTERGLWESADGGATWKKIKAPKGILRVHFFDERRGLAAGTAKALYQTSDGGQTWARVPAVDELKTRREYTHFTSIAFASPQVGMVVGYSRPPRRSDRDLPAWIDPEKAQGRREVPNLGIVMATTDAGATWRPMTVSMFGRFTRIRVRPSGEAIALVEFDEGFDYAAEVYSVNWRDGKNERVFRDKTRAVTDVALGADGAVYLGGYEAAGELRRLPIPAKVKILRSADYKTWREMDVDYRAVCRRLVFATGAERIWAATDTGMILQLEP